MALRLIYVIKTKEYKYSQALIRHLQPWSLTWELWGWLRCGGLFLQKHLECDVLKPLLCHHRGCRVLWVSMPPVLYHAG